ncbi:MarR family transcriptional regulator [Spongiactinospora sp. TRM90649]|uniref:MarR family winged helix-turn-helix transcriptional regulator n=1 Tax=Spongiactinospora sp. TRM90649 TaxID=3031114 RepID=UPI0023F7DD09|nr:MarR family transcriptional regulator [Spongiactinospora sp. TRM90649]MDF5751935.1 MarR family transcriptional regulator [Spongiactinospora sp. TRM90649]
MTNPAPDREGVLAEVVGKAIPGWAILVVQLNNLVADRLGVTDTDVQCLHVLGRHGPTTPSVLARHVNLTTGSTSRMIDRLVAAGCVRRVADPVDRRRVLIEPTQDGLDRVTRAYAGLVARTRDDLDDFDDGELGAVLRFLETAQRSTAAEIHRLRSAPED